MNLTSAVHRSFWPFFVYAVFIEQGYLHGQVMQTLDEGMDI